MSSADQDDEDSDLEHLKVQLMMLPDLLKTANAGEALYIQTVSSIGLLSNTFSQTFLGEVNRLLRFYLTVPMSSAT